ncbi:MAG: DUF4234 domain-containing protein [Thermoleophilia bacterium]
MTNLEADIRQRTITDWQTGFWTAFLLSIVTCGIYMFYVIYKLLERREQHFERMVSFRTHLIEVLRERAEAGSSTGLSPEVEADFSQLEGINLDVTNRDRAGDKSPVLWLVLSIVVSPIVYYVYYFLNDDFRAHEANEHQFMLKASEVMNKVGITQNQIVTPMVIPERNFITFLLLTFVTCGIYGIYWLYTIITDPNYHFDNHATWEAQVLALLQS